MQSSNLMELTMNLISLCKSQENLVITGHDMPDQDSIISSVMMKMLLDSFGVDAKIKFGTKWDIYTERDMKNLGIGQDISFDGFSENDTLLLVDHPKSFYPNQIIACVDHHTTLPRPDFQFNFVRGASSCGKIIFDMMKSVGKDSRESEILALYSVFFDTQGCRSLKYNQEDTPWVEECIAKYSLDREELDNLGCCLNSPDEDIETVAMNGFKRYDFFGKASISTCIQVDRTNDAWKSRIPEIVEFLKKRVSENGYLVCALVINMPKDNLSDIYFIHNSGQVDYVRLPRLASRSRDVIPVLSDMSRACSLR